jgi:hypothetical protein
MMGCVFFFHRTAHQECWRSQLSILKSGNPTYANRTGITGIVNLESKQTASLRGSSPLDPEVLADCSALLSTAAPLVSAYRLTGSRIHMIPEVRRFHPEGSWLELVS